MSDHACVETSLSKKLLIWFEFICFGSLLLYFMYLMFMHVLGYLGIGGGGGH